MINNNHQTPNRIPVRFVEEENKADLDESSDAPEDGALTPDEIGRASSYEDETEVQRRIDRGAEEDSAEGQDKADDRDTAGGPAPADLPEFREDQETTRRSMTFEDKPAQNDARRERKSPSVSSVAELLAAQAELQMVESALQKVTAERQELMEVMARRQADFDNYRKRMERERGETYNRVVGEVVGQLLPVMDNLRRALEVESSMEASESEEFKHFLHGVELIGKQLSSVLEELGLETVAAVGHPFDPHVHEAIATEQTDEFPPDTVMQEIVRGYRLRDRLLRPALVKVATK